MFLGRFLELMRAWPYFIAFLLVALMLLGPWIIDSIQYDREMSRENQVRELEEINKVASQAKERHD